MSIDVTQQFMAFLNAIMKQHRFPDKNIAQMNT
jgi:hypothetical protein